jgi:broad specificity phosphatase PhoE
MSTLTLVRHGRACAFQRESDVLSAIGEKQARQLAAFWLKNGVHFHQVYTGTLVRQIRTELVVAESLRDAGACWPVAEQDCSWNEYDATGVLTRIVPVLAARDARFATLVEAFEKARGGADQNRYFQPMFEAAMTAWLNEASVEGVEPWPAFRDRISGAIRRLMLGPAGRRVAVFTSGGPIGFAVQFALSAPDQSFLDVNWRIRNCSITEFVYTKDRFTLDTFNGLAHIEDSQLRTYR